MKVSKLVALSILLGLASAHVADARPRPKSFGGGRSQFEANKTFGLGLELGYPNGLTGKYFVSSSTALDFGLGYAYRYYYAGDGLNVYMDYLWHPFVLAKTEPFELPFYIGVGGHFWDFDDGCDRNGRNCTYNGTAVGVRVPIGIAFDFNNIPLDIFIQVTPTLDFFRHYNRDAYLGFWPSVGVRFWFN